MSDRGEELRNILFGDDSGDDPGPLDGERAGADTAAVSEAAEDETNDLSPEELVAASVRQTNEELGLEDAEDGEEESAAAADVDEPDDIAALKEKARRWEEYEAQQAERAVESQRQEIIAEAQKNESKRKAETQRYKDFYKNEQIRLLAQVDADAEQAPNPEAYRRIHRQNVIDACRREEDLKIAEVEATCNAKYAELNTQFEAIDQQVQLAQQKPAYTDFLFEKLNLPTEDLEIRAEILKAGDGLTGEDALSAMTKRAREIAFVVEYLRNKSQELDQTAREVKAREVKKSQPHPASATNAPRRAKPVKYAESGPERKKQLAAIFALR